MLPPLTVLWANLHGGFFVGIVLVAAYGLRRRPGPWVAAAAGCAVASLVNPYGWRLHLHIASYLTDPFLYAHIAEFRSISFQHSMARFFEALCALAAAAALCLPLAALPWAGSLAPFMAGLFVVMFGASGFIVLSMAYGTRVFSTAHSSLVAGVGAGAWSAAVAVFMPVLGRLFDLHRYSTAFVAAAAFPLAGLLAWRLLDRPPRRPSGSGVPLL